MQRLTLPQALLACTVLLVIGALVYAGKDTAGLVTAAVAILGALGFIVQKQAEVQQQTVAVREQTNGNTKELLALVSKQQDQIIELSHKLAEMTPPR